LKNANLISSKMKNAVEWNTHFNSPSGQNRKKKNSLKKCVFALKIQCHVVKNTLLQAAFSAILL